MTKVENKFNKLKFKSLVASTLLDLYEFSLHSFESLKGEYYLNNVGINFISWFPKDDVIKQTKSVNAKIVYLAHTHPLANDNSLKFLGAKIDPREEIAFGYRELPLGNAPSDGDIIYFHRLQKEFADENIEIIGAVFAASGMWEFNIIDKTNFNVSKFKAGYKKHFSTVDDELFDFMKNWNAMQNFPSYFGEVKVPSIHKSKYLTKLHDAEHTGKTDNREKINSIINFFNKYGVSLVFHDYESFGIDPRALMRKYFNDWSEKFVK